jgi:hypothetical protein
MHARIRSRLYWELHNYRIEIKMLNDKDDLENAIRSKKE